MTLSPFVSASLDESTLTTHFPLLNLQLQPGLPLPPPPPAPGLCFSKSGGCTQETVYLASTVDGQWSTV